MGHISISPYDINPSVPPHAILIKLLSIMKAKCPGATLAFIRWTSLIGNQTLNESKTSR